MENFYYKNNSGNYRIDPARYLELLQKNGFYKLYMSGGPHSPILIQVNENKLVSQQSVDRIVDFTKGYLQEKHKKIESQLWKAFIEQGTICPKTLGHLQVLYPDMLMDTRDRCFIPYRNFIVEITRDAVNYVPWEENAQYLWDKHLIGRDIVPAPEFTLDGDFYHFLIDLSIVPDIAEESELRLKSLMGIVGYLVHTYKDPSNPRAVVLTDPFEGNAGIANGGVGKTLFVDCISQIRRVQCENGKNFNSKSQFALQSYEYGTPLICIDDVSAKFRFEDFFSYLTAGIQVEKKYQDKVFIPYPVSPKIIITSNYSLNGAGASFERRKYEFSLSRTFSPSYLPVHKYGHLFFTGWDHVQWHMFDHTIIRCVQLFLSESSVIKSDETPLWAKVAGETSPPFSGYFEAKLPHFGEINRKDMYDDYVHETGDNTLSTKRFYDFVRKAYGMVSGHELQEKKNNGNVLFVF